MEVKEESEKVGLKYNIQKTKVMASGPITSWNIDGETMETVTEIIFLVSKITTDGDCGHEIKRYLRLGRKSFDKPRQHIKKKRYYIVNKASQSYGFSSSHVWMWELGHKEGWVLKYWCFSTVLLEKTLESPLDGREIQPVPPKGDQPWIFMRRTDTEAEAPILWPLDEKSERIRKDPEAGKGWRQEERGKTEDKIVGWCHQLNVHEFEQALGDGEGHGSLVCYSSWGHSFGHDWAT